MDDSIYERLNDVFRDVLDDDDISLTPATTAADVENWDSLNHVRIIVATERAFGVRFNTADISGLRNVGEFVRLIRKAQES